MPLEEKKYDIEANNDWAKNVKGEHLFIDSVQSGRKGYFCIGCDKQMEAVKKKNINHRSYFRHVPVDIAKDETPCTFSNRQYREILATDILQRLKTIKVPNIYKYPPKGEEGAPMLLEKAKFIKAYEVKSQLTFYEDNEGAVKYGKNPNVEDRYLLIRPDVTFFDANNNPILFIELVITHRVSEEKKIKLRRIGIDAVSIIVPKSSEQDIEDNFKTTKKVKWEYNGDEANTKYVPVSSGTSEGVLEFNEDQRRIFEESLSCRKSRLSNTLRTIRKCLQSESYRRTERDFESEISRIETAAKGERQGLEEMEGRFDDEVFSDYRGEFDGIIHEQEVIEGEREKFQQQIKQLEGRYFGKAREIEEEQRAIDELRKEKYGYDKTEEEIRAEFEEQEQIIAREFRERTNKVADSICIGNASIAKLKEEESDLPDFFGQIEGEASEEFEIKRKELEEYESNLEKYVREEFYREVRTGSREFPKGVKNILEAQRMGHDFEDAKRKENRYKRARELFNKGAWKE